MANRIKKKKYGSVAKLIKVANTIVSKEEVKVVAYVKELVSLQLLINCLSDIFGKKDKYTYEGIYEAFNGVDKSLYLSLIRPLVLTEDATEADEVTLHRLVVLYLNGLNMIAGLVAEDLYRLLDTEDMLSGESKSIDKYRLLHILHEYSRVIDIIIRFNV